MDDGANERLSRFVDDDLPAEDAARLEAAMAQDDRLRQQVEAIRSLRGAVRRLADGMEPPRQLDAALEPLRRTPSPRAATWWQWMGAAAAVVAAALLGVEMIRHVPEHTPPADETRTAERQPAREPFELKPLPRFVRDPEEGLRDVPTPAISDSRALDVIGPVDTDPTGGVDTSRDGPARREGSLRVVVDGIEREISGLAVSLPPGRYPVRLTVARGRITSAVTTQGDGASTPIPEAVGLAAPGGGLNDGEHLAELVVPADEGGPAAR